jgi:hypothetical protein
MSMESSLWEIPQQAAGRERGHVVILGFLMGVAISAAIGAALYLYLTVG